MPRRTKKSIHPSDRRSILAEKFQRTWLDVEYDGVRGKLPDWVPQSHRSQFALLQYRFFNAILNRKFSLKDLMVRFRWELKEGERIKSELERDGEVIVDLSAPPSSGLTAYVEDVETLASLFACVSKGPVGGLDLLLGESLANSARHGQQSLMSAKAGLQRSKEIRTIAATDRRAQILKAVQKEIECKTPARAINKKVALSFTPPLTVQHVGKVRRESNK